MLLVLLGLFTSVYLIYHFYWKRRNFPPGPLPLPLIGNLHTIARNAPGYEAFCNWREQYGPVYTYWIANMPAVAVTDFKTLHETFIKDGDAYADRMRFEEMTNVVRGGNFGIIECDGELWREHRRFTLHVLRDFGLGKNLMQERILDEVVAMLSSMKQEMNNGVNMQNQFDVCVGSIINAILFGYRFEGAKRAEFESLKAMLSDHMRMIMNPTSFMLMTNPSLRHLPFFNRLYAKIMGNVNRLFTFFLKQIEEHEKVFDKESEPSDYVNAFLKEMHKRRDNNLKEEGFHTMQLKNTIFDLWIAGMETTSNTLTWAILYLLHNPDCQRRIHEEFDREIGSSDRLINMNDKIRLNYCNAVINETQRCANLLVQNVFHKTARDVVIDGYRVAKGTLVLPQISVVLLDEKIFPDAKSFNPDRFLDEKGQLKKVEEFVPFSIGKRQCLGEGLARMELFLILANFLNHFKVEVLKRGETISGIAHRQAQFADVKKTNWSYDSWANIFFQILPSITKIDS